MKRSTDGYKFSFGRVSPNATPKFTSIEIPVDELTKERRSSSLKKISKLKTDFSQIQSDLKNRTTSGKHRDSINGHIDMNYSLKQFQRGDEKKSQSIGYIRQQLKKKNFNRPQYSHYEIMMSSAPSTPKNHVHRRDQREKIKQQVNSQINQSSIVSPKQTNQFHDSNMNRRHPSSYLEIYKQKKQKKYYSLSFFRNIGSQSPKCLKPKVEHKDQEKFMAVLSSKKNSEDKSSKLFSKYRPLKKQRKLMNTAGSKFENQFELVSINEMQKDRRISQRDLQKLKLHFGFKFRDRIFKNSMTTKTVNIKERIKKLRVNNFNDSKGLL